MGKENEVCLETAQDFVGYVPVDFNKDLLSYKVVKPEKITAPVKQGEEIGKAVFYYDNKEMGSVPLAATQRVGFSIISKINTKVLFIISLIVLVLLIIKYTASRKRELREKRRKVIKKNIK